MLSNYCSYLVSFIYAHAVTDQQKIVIPINFTADSATYYYLNSTVYTFTMK